MRGLRLELFSTGVVSLEASVRANVDTNGGKIVAGWLVSHGRSRELIRLHSVHPMSKNFWIERSNQLPIHCTNQSYGRPDIGSMSHDSGALGRKLIKC